MKLFIWWFLLIFFIGIILAAYYVPAPWQDTVMDVAGAGVFISCFGLAVVGRPKKIGPDGKVYKYWNGFYIYKHPDGKVDFWPGDGKGDGDKKE